MKKTTLGGIRGGKGRGWEWGGCVREEGGKDRWRRKGWKNEKERAYVRWRRSESGRKIELREV